MRAVLRSSTAGWVVFLYFIILSTVTCIEKRYITEVNIILAYACRPILHSAISNSKPASLLEQA
jgi:hypothetical protein